MIDRNYKKLLAEGKLMPFNERITYKLSNRITWVATVPCPKVKASETVTPLLYLIEEIFGKFTIEIPKEKRFFVGQGKSIEEAYENLKKEIQFYCK